MSVQVPAVTGAREVRAIETGATAGAVSCLTGVLGTSFGSSVRTSALHYHLSSPKHYTILYLYRNLGLTFKILDPGLKVALHSDAYAPPPPHTHTDTLHTV